MGHQRTARLRRRRGRLPDPGRSTEDHRRGRPVPGAVAAEPPGGARPFAPGRQRGAETLLLRPGARRRALRQRLLRTPQPYRRRIPDTSAGGWRRVPHRRPQVLFERRPARPLGTGRRPRRRAARAPGVHPARRAGADGDRRLVRLRPAHHRQRHRHPGQRAGAGRARHPAPPPPAPYRSSSRPPSTPASPVASSPRPCSRCAATRGHG